MEQILHNIAAAAGVLVPVLYTLLAAAALDLITGLFAAFVSGTLQWTYVSEFVRGHLLQKIAPIMGLLLAGVAVGGTNVEAGLALVAAGATGAAAYLASVVASIGGNVTAARDKTKGLPTTLVPAAPVVTSVGEEGLDDPISTLSQ